MYAAYPYRYMVTMGRSTRHSSTRPWNALASANARLNDRIVRLKREGLYRTFVRLERRVGLYPTAWLYEADLRNTEEVVSFCSNDYLSMGQHPLVLEAMQTVLRDSGSGAGGTRSISGTTPHHTRLETEIADLHTKEAGLLFTSCFVANDSSIGTLGKLLPGCEICSDANNHASLISGMKRDICDVADKHGAQLDLTRNATILHVPTDETHKVPFCPVYRRDWCPTV